jgi:hypothetical protein
MAGKDKTYKFKVDDVQFETETAVLTGEQIKQKAQIGGGFQLFLEVPGKKKEDRLVNDTDTVDFSEPGIEKLYSVPAATFGFREHR